MKQKTELKFSSLKTLAVGTVDPANPPKRLKIFNWGENVSANKGTFKVGDKTLATLSANQKKFGFDTVALDFEHNTFPGTTAYKESSEPRKVAAHGPLDVVQGDGVYLNVGWTPEGPKDAVNYPDLSPVPATDENGEVVFIHSVALCRQGEVPDLHFSSLAVSLEEAGADVPAFTLEQFTALNAEVASLKSQVPSLTALSAEITNLKSQITNFQTLETKLTALSNDWKTNFEKGERETICLLARYDGKDLSHLSAEIIGRMTPVELRGVVAKINPTIPVTRLTPLSVTDPAAKDKAAADAKAASQKEKATSLSKQHPDWAWNRCWEEAGK